MVTRTFDFIVACLALIAAVPVMSVIAVLIKASSSGSIFFRQYRVGLNEEIFRVYKFRTMVERAEEMGTSVTAQDDPRITAVGKILRRLKLDELPQLINVFKGDMSLVGPRPDVLEIAEKYTPEMKRIFQIRPGITSVATLHLRDEEEILAQVDDPDAFYEDTLVPLKIKLAMEHVDKKSFAFDLKILCQTIWTLSLGRWWPIAEHPGVGELRREDEKMGRWEEKKVRQRAEVRGQRTEVRGQRTEVRGRKAEDEKVRRWEDGKKRR